MVKFTDSEVAMEIQKSYHEQKFACIINRNKAWEIHGRIEQKPIRMDYCHYLRHSYSK